MSGPHCFHQKSVTFFCCVNYLFDLSMIYSQRFFTKNMLTFGKEVEWAKMGEPLLLKIEQSALQYVIIKVLTTIVTIVAEAGGVYNEGRWAFDSVYAYVAIIVNF